MYECDLTRMKEKITTFSKFGDTGHGGITRFSLSPAAIQARNEIISRMKKLGLEIKTDDLGDIYCTLPGTDPSAGVIMSGSHCDSVRQGGNYDGILGVLTAMEDKRLPCVADYIPSELMSKKLSPVGRLDYHTSGLLIITNDGELSHRLQSPKYEVPKIYLATFRGLAWTEEEIATVAKGFTIRDKGYAEQIAPADLKVIESSEDGFSQALLTLHEGKTHEVRRIFANFNKEVTALRRIELAGIKISRELDSCGMFRPLDESELKLLFAATGMA